MTRQLLIPLVLVSLLSACAKRPADSIPLPIQKPITPIIATLPSANWVDLGVSPDGNVLNEIDSLSMKHTDSLVEFRDRKTIFDLDKENFLNIPRHKVSINTWEIDCKAQTFRLENTLLFDEKGRQIADFSYNDEQIKQQNIVKDSASYQQMLYVCKSEDR